MKKKLLLVAGAGASVEFGMPSVADVRAILTQEAQKSYPLADWPSTNLFEEIENLVVQYWRKNVPRYLYRHPHFEDLLYTIFALATAYPAGANTAALGALIEARKLPDCRVFSHERKSIGSIELRHLGCLLVDSLLAVFRDRCKAVVASKAAEFARLQHLIDSLQEEFDIAVITLNYDNVIHQTLPGIETGFDVNGRFIQKRIFEQTNWPRLLHLHGSVHFNMRQIPGGGLHEILWETNLNATFQNSLGRNSHATIEGVDFPMSVIVAGYGKTTQLLRRPFRTYYSELDRLVNNCDAALFAGYGFGDTHLNMAFEGFRDFRNRPIVVISYASDDALTMGSAEFGDHNQTINNLIRTFKTDLHNMQALGHSGPGTVKNLKAAKEFEVCTNLNTPLSLWYNGMLAACDHPSKVIAQLR